MKIYYDPRQYPEMALIPEQERARVWKAFLRRLGFWDWRGFSAFGLFFVFFLAGVLGMNLIDSRFPDHEWFSCITLTVFIISGIVLMCVAYITLLKCPFAQFMKDREDRQR